MSIDFTPAERAALDRATVPALRASFAADLVSAALASGAAPPRRDSRGGWRRHGRVLIGAGALFVASATAAATGWLDHLPIRIPGITRAAPAPVVKPKHVVRVERSRAEPGRVALVAAPPTPIPTAPDSLEQWQTRRAARIAAGLPVAPRRPLVRRALAEKWRALPPDQRRAAIADWHRIQALPPAERKLEIAKIRGAYLAEHPRLAARFERRLERRSAAAVAAGDPTAPPAALAAPPSDAVRDARRERRRERRMRRDGWPAPIR